ncbi:hypothetical protein [Bordetella avium]|uniref:Exported protein n=1 Tax=Bordetella avium (strain 197N) TaxID=360910 RepID=Q2KY55_BORA1|nr:hypothetical protein [Bordetella avium]RIQ49436.1 hypothetical protein D0843_13040 [Bordetella avium]RIQ74691.1 hypothetical protein D0838_05765 [Bordetella avium]CAJ48162.1 putative exported protein [Bordetella avium 197N]
MSIPYARTALAVWGYAHASSWAHTASVATLPGLSAMRHPGETADDEPTQWLIGEGRRLELSASYRF